MNECKNKNEGPGFTANLTSCSWLLRVERVIAPDKWAFPWNSQRGNWPKVASSKTATSFGLLIFEDLLATTGWNMQLNLVKNGLNKGSQQ